MAKDPAILLFKDKWLVATKGMKADAKGWYLNLIIYQHDMGDLPNDIEELANLCDVRISEYENFKQVFEHVLKQKFKLNENGRLENEVAKEILKNRESFLDKRSNSGKLSYVLRYFRSKHKLDEDFEKFIKENIDLNIDIKNEQVLKQVFKQISELYINVNVNNNISYTKEDIEEIYKTYPSNCMIKKERSLGKCSKNKDQIEKLLKSKSKEEIIKTIEEYKTNCVLSGTYMKNFGTFLNQFPDYSEKEQSNQKLVKWTTTVDKGEREGTEEQFLNQKRMLGEENILTFEYI